MTGFSTGASIAIGQKLSEKINNKRLSKFIADELAKIPLSEKDKVELFTVVRYDNFFFQKRFVFFIKNDYLFIKKQLDRKSSWVNIPIKSITAKLVPPPTGAKFGVKLCGDLIQFESGQDNGVLSGKKFLVEKNLGEQVCTYDKEKTQELYGLFKH